MKSAEQIKEWLIGLSDGYTPGDYTVGEVVDILQAFAASQQCGGVKWVRANERLPEVGQDVITIHPITRTKSFLIYEAPSDFEDGEEWLDESSTPCRCLEMEKEIERLRGLLKDQYLRNVRRVESNDVSEKMWDEYCQTFKLK